MILNGKILAARKLKALKQKIASKQLTLQLDVIYVKKNLPSEIFIRKKQEAALETGIKFNLHTFEENVTYNVIQATCNRLNTDPNCTGYFIQLPIPRRLKEYKVENLIVPEKDVDCLGNTALGSAIKNPEESVLPATVEAIVFLLEHSKVSIESKVATIVNDSNLIGKPLGAYLLSCGATVNICNEFTKDIAQFTKNTDIIITAVGKPNLVGKEMVKKGAIVIDAGISKLNGKTIGDVDYSGVKTIAKFITPVPGGVGPLTVACLLENLLKIYEASSSRSTTL